MYTTTKKTKCARNFGRMPAAYDLHDCTGGHQCDGRCQPISGAAEKPTPGQIHATGDTWHRGDGLDDGEPYESRLKAIADRDDIRAAMSRVSANRATAADIVKRQHATISLAIELMTAELAGMTDGTDPDGVTWRDIEPHASTADLAELICEQHARRKP